MRRANSLASSTAALARALADRLQGKAAPSLIMSMSQMARAGEAQEDQAQPSASAEDCQRAVVGTRAHDARRNGHAAENGTCLAAAAAGARRLKPPSKPAANTVHVQGTGGSAKQLQLPAQPAEGERTSKRRRADQAGQLPAQRRCKGRDQAPEIERQATGTSADPRARQRASSRRRCRRLCVDPCLTAILVHRIARLQGAVALHWLKVLLGTVQPLHPQRARHGSLTGYLLKRVPKAGRVAFAPGPLPTADGHPQHEGRQTARRVRELANDWGRSLTPEHVRALQHELGPENAASVERLKRRCGPAAEAQCCVGMPAEQLCARCKCTQSVDIVSVITEWSTRQGSCLRRMHMPAVHLTTWTTVCPLRTCRVGLLPPTLRTRTYITAQRTDSISTKVLHMRPAQCVCTHLHASDAGCDRLHRGVGSYLATLLTNSSDCSYASILKVNSIHSHPRPQARNNHRPTARRLLFRDSRTVMGLRRS